MVWIYAEVSNLRIPSSGHAYFSLKDDKAQISGVMFRGQMKQMKFDLEDGLSIVGLGRISVYEPRGTYQIIMEYIEPQGLGALQLAYEQLKRKLSDEGLFDAQKKTSLPFLPHKIGIITSPTGAVIRDILYILERRYPNLEIIVLPVRVQGERAVDEIVHALAIANNRKDIDVLILARGGGSLEDLSAFNSEAVARAIFASELPVICAVGHETDYTIADFVADQRAPTPSAAAEIVVPIKSDLMLQHAALRKRCKSLIVLAIKQKRDTYFNLRKRIIHPIKIIRDLQLRADDYGQRVQRAISNRVGHLKIRHKSCYQMLLYNKPDNYISKYKDKVHILTYKLLKKIEKKIIHHREHLKALNVALSVMNPKAVLLRGYSITRSLPDKAVVVDSASVSKNKHLEVILAKGALEVNVVKRHLSAKKTINSEK